MKANYTEFETHLGVEECGSIFQHAVHKRPLKLKTLRFEFFAPDQGQDPFASLGGSVSPDFEVGASYQMAELFGTVVMSCLVQGDETLVSLRSTGNMRGRTMTNSLVKHILKRFKERDPGLVPETSSGRI